MDNQSDALNSENPICKIELIDVKNEQIEPLEDDVDMTPQNTFADGNHMNIDIEDTEVKPLYVTYNSTQDEEGIAVTKEHFSKVVSSKQGREYCDSEKLIIEVGKRPGLYNKELPEYSDKIVREKLWTEVCEAIVPSWNRLDILERIVISNDFQRKWRNMRDSFRKEVNGQRRRKSADRRQKRRKYIYFEELQFLLPTIQRQTTTGSYSSPPNSDAEKRYNEETKSLESDRQVAVDLNLNSNRSVSTKTHRGRTEKRKRSSYEESRVKILKESKVEYIDEDKSFLLSLLPSFKELTTQQKLMTKMEFLQVLQRVMFSQNAENQQNHTNTPSLATFSSQTTNSYVQPQTQARTTHCSTEMTQCSSQSTSHLQRPQRDPIDKYVSSISLISDVPSCSIPISTTLSPDNSTQPSTPDSELFEF